jgi:hypothetical protein
MTNSDLTLVFGGCGKTGRAGDVPEPFVDADDIADVAVAEALGRPPRDFAGFAAAAWGSR